MDSAVGNEFNKLFDNWNEQIKKKKRIHVLCKPCWELKYCPYGSFVEKFPITNDTIKSCVIFQHDCPVFYVAEPFTETRDTRRMMRNISSATKRKIDRRDNMHCQNCNKHLLDEDVNYDHIIPWSLGGSSDENNIRLICKSCNLEKSKNLPADFLVDAVSEHLRDKIELNDCHLTDLLNLFQGFMLLTKTLGHNPSERQFCKLICDDETDIETDKFMYSFIIEIKDCMDNLKTFFRKNKDIQIIQYRWGYNDIVNRNIYQTCKKYKISEEAFINIEKRFFAIQGFSIIIKNKENYVKYKSNYEHYKKMVETLIASEFSGSVT